MEIGSFIELQLPRGMEFYNQTDGCARLNTGRSAIVRAFQLLGRRRVWLPVYQCDTVRDALKAAGAEIRYYHIDRSFNPVDLPETTADTVLLANYFGVMSHRRMAQLSAPYPNAIIDNCQAFFCPPVEGKMNVYSCRKFVGVPDGAYLIGPGAERGLEELPQGYSSDTAGFLFTRIEYGCEGKGYAARKINEDRIDSEGVMRMSALTRAILDGTDYGLIRRRRRRNFAYAHSLLGAVNLIDPTEHYGPDTVPMVYPLMVEDSGLLDRLQRAKHFQGHWWSYICDEQPTQSVEHWLSRYIIPLTIDQRYDSTHIDFLTKTILSPEYAL